MVTSVKRNIIRGGSVVLIVAIMLTILAILPLGSVFAQTPLAFQKDLDATAQVSRGGNINLVVSMDLTGTVVGHTHELEYIWRKNGTLVQSANMSNATVSANVLTITNAQKENEGVYTVEVYCKSDVCKSVPKSYSRECSLTVGSVGSGSLVVTGYTVQDASGKEIQSVNIGEKCQIVIGLRDGRLTGVPSKVDSYGNVANFKITTTTSFASPSFGDIRMTAPKVVDGAIEYAVIFNDIMYLGGENSLGFDVSYNDQAIAMQNIAVNISQCYNPAKSTSTKPTIMVKESSYGGTSVGAGSTFALNLSSYNTSKTEAVTDVVTSVTLPATITLAGGSNVALHEIITPSGAIADTFALQVLHSAETGIANITVNYTYYVQGTDTQLTSSQVITVPIVQPDRFSFTSLEVPDVVYAGEDNVITLNFVNKGKGILYNLSAEIDGNISDVGQYQYIGNLNSGTEGSVDFSIKSDGVGPVSGTIKVIYEDVNGTEQQKIQEYSFTVQAAPTQDIYDPSVDYNPEPTQTGMPWWVWVIIGVGAVAVVVGVVIIVKKKKAKKRAAELLEDEDDEDEDF